MTATSKQAAYEQALHPPRKPVTADEFDQIIYDAVARDKTISREAIVRWAHRTYEVLTSQEFQRREDFGPNGDATTPGFFSPPMSIAQAFQIPAGSACDDSRPVNPTIESAPEPRASKVFHQQDGRITKAYYAELSALGPIGLVALNLFRAQKRSSRAKDYRRGKWRRAAYDVKSWSMDELCRILAEHGEALGIKFGWKEDAGVVFGSDPSFVLYVELPQGQISFHQPHRGAGPDYPGEWDGRRGASEERIIRFCDGVSGAA